MAPTTNETLGQIYAIATSGGSLEDAQAVAETFRVANGLTGLAAADALAVAFGLNPAPVPPGPIPPEPWSTTIWNWMTAIGNAFRNMPTVVTVPVLPS